MRVRRLLSFGLPSVPHSQGGKGNCATRGQTTVTFPVTFGAVLGITGGAYNLQGGQNYGMGQGFTDLSTTRVTVKNTSETAERYWSQFFYACFGTA